MGEIMRLLRHIFLSRSFERDEAGARAFLEGKVARYKQPARIVFWAALPKSGYGKVPKRVVRDELEARGLLDLYSKQTD